MGVPVLVSQNDNAPYEGGMRNYNVLSQRSEFMSNLSDLGAIASQIKEFYASSPDPEQYRSASFIYDALSKFSAGLKK